MNDRNFAAEYQALKDANNEFRERGKRWLWNTLDLLSSEISRELSEKPGGLPLQVGRQEWQFRVESATMVGERYGARHRAKTLIVEAGWPRLPEHGYISGNGLALGRIGLSQNTMLDAGTIAEMVLKRIGSNDIAWFLITHKQTGDRIDEARLRHYLRLLLSD